MQPRLKFAAKLKADKKTRAPLDNSHSFEIFSLNLGFDETFNVQQRLKNAYNLPKCEQYQKILLRKLKNFSPEDAALLLKLVLSVVLCPIRQDPVKTAKFFENKNALLKELFGTYMNPTAIDAIIIGYRDRDHHVLEELQQEITLTNTEHPLYPKRDFDSDADYDEWKENRLAELSRKVKSLEKQPPFTGKLSVNVIKAEGLDGNGIRGESSSVYFIIKVAEQVQRTTHYVTNTWNPIFIEETFTFDVPARDCRIKIELWDKGFIGSTFLGCIMTKPSELMWIDQPYEKAWPLGSRIRSKDTGITGNLFVRFNLSFKIGPYRPNYDANLSKSGFLDSFFSPTSNASGISSLTNSNSSPPGSPTVSTQSLSTSTNSNSLVSTTNSRANRSSNSYNSLSKSTSSFESSDPGNDALPAPPPIINSHLNNYPEWYSSLLSVALLHAFNHPPPSDQDLEKSNNSTSSSVDVTPSTSNPGSQPVPIMVLPSNSSTPLKTSPKIISGTPLLRASTAYESNGLDLDFYGRGSPSLQGSTNWGNLNTLSDSGGLENASPTSRDFLTGSGNSIMSRSAPVIRGGTPTKKSFRSGTPIALTLGSSGGSLGSLEEESQDPVKYCPEIQWLLENFVERFSIDPCLSPLLQLELLESSFTVQSLPHLEAIHAAIVELQANRAIAPLKWTKVSHMYERVVGESLKSRLDDAICNYFLRFPRNDPKGALSLAIVLYSVITRSELPQLCLILHDKIETTMIKMYKVIVGEKITESALLDAVRFTIHAIDHDNRYFNEVFPCDLMLMNLSIKTYYTELLSKNVKSWLRNSPPISDITMHLYSFLCRLNSQVSKILPGYEIIPAPILFQPFVGKWIDRIGDTLPYWCRNELLKRENWKSISTDASQCILHAPSVQLLFDAFSKVYLQYRQFDMRSSKDMKSLAKIFVTTLSVYMQGIASKAVDLFAVQGNPQPSKRSPITGRNSPKIATREGRSGSFGDLLAMNNQMNVPTSLDSYPSPRYTSPSSSSFWNMWGIIPTNSHKSSAKSAPNLFHIPKESCVWISSIETVTQKLYDFCKQMQTDGEKGADDIRSHFGDIFSQLLQLQSQICQLVVKLINTNPTLELSLDTFLSYTPDLDKITDAVVLESLEPLFDYLNSRVEVLSANLDTKVFIRLLEQIWLVLIKDIEVLVFPIVGDKKMETKKAQFVEYSLPYLQTFFEAGNDGLSKDFLDTESSSLRAAFGMLKVPSNVLMKAWTDISNGLSPSGIPHTDGIDNMTLECHIISVMSSRKSDKDAKKFVKQNKVTTLNRSTLKAFDLPKGETLVDWFTCRKGKEINFAGYLYITTNYLCFDTYLWGDHQLTIPIADIRSIKRKKTTLNVTNGITVKLRDNNQTPIHFTSLNKPKAYDIIAEQAAKIGVALEVYEKSENGSPSNQSSGSHTPSSSSFAHDRQNTPKYSRYNVMDDNTATPDIDEVMSITGARRIENEDDMRSHFGLQKTDIAIAAFDCAISVDVHSGKGHSGSLSGSGGMVGSGSNSGLHTPTSEQFDPGILYLFSRSLCFRGVNHKVMLSWANITNLGQKGSNFYPVILAITKEKKKIKQYSFGQLKAIDDVFAAMHMLWLQCKAN